MRKFLAGFLLTLRWLLVPLIPVLGFVVGWWMIPIPKPTWERTLDEYVKCIETRYDGTKSSLLLFDHRRIKEGDKAYQCIVGLDSTTGTELFTRKIPCDGFTKLVVVPGTTYALRWEFDAPDSLVLYDWEHEVVHRQLITGARLSQIGPPQMKKNVLVTVIGGPTLLSIACWRLDDRLKADVIKITSQSPMVRDLQLSSTGDWLVTGSQLITGGAGAPVEYCVELFETKQGKKLQTLSSQIERIRWLEDADAFMALHRDEINAKQWWQKYVRENDSFVPAGVPIVLPRMGIVWNQDDGSHAVVVSTNINDITRNKLKGWLGKDQQWILERLWPESTILDTYRSATGELVDSLTIPGFGSPNVFDMANGTKTIHPTPDGKGLVMQKGRQLSYWQFQPTSRWYPWIGLGLGVILSIIVARWNLRRGIAAKAPDTVLIP